MRKLLMTGLALLIATVMMAQRDVATIKINVYSTKARIEKAAKGVDGVRNRPKRRHLQDRASHAARHAKRQQRSNIE